MTTVKCFQFLNIFLWRNICGLLEGRIGILLHNINDPSSISEALQYSCLHWATHLSEGLVAPPADTVSVLSQLCTFTDKYLLHWFECLSAFGEIEYGLTSLSKAKEAASVSTACGEEF